MIPVLYTKKETAEMLRISPATLDKLVATGWIVSTKIGWQVRFTEKSFNDFIKSGEA
jgi:excisionase family DNA binding protein